MKKIAVAMLSLLTLVVGAFAGPYDAWTKYRPITINTQASGGGANVASSQSNFPVLVRFSNATPASGADVLSEALSGGADVRFTSGDGETALPFEIEAWSSTAAAVWVRVPTINGNANTNIRVYWKKSGEVTASSPSGVFGSNNFLGVWHFGNTSGAAARPNAVNDGSANNATPAGPSPATLTPKSGVIGFSDSLRAQGATTNGDHFSMGSITYPNQEVTVSMWMYYPSPQVNTTWAHFFGMGNSSSSHALWFGRVDATQNIRFRGAGGTGGSNPSTTGETDNEGSTTVTNMLVPANEWAQVAVTRDSTFGKRWRIYKNGSIVADYFRGATTGTNEDRHNFGNVARSTHFIGRPVGWGDPGANIKVDETRISSIARSPEWMKLEYETQKEAPTAVSLGAPAYTSARPLAYELKDVVYAHNTPIATNSPVLGIPSLGTPVSYAIDSPLPNGLNFNTTTGVISGTPNGIAALDTFIVTATFADTVGRDTISILVNPAAPANLAYPSTTPIYGVNVAIAANTPTVSSLVDANQLVTSFSVNPALPTGLTLNATTGEITGTPTVASAAANYIVTATNATGSTSQTLNITVLALPSALSYSQHPVTYSAGVVSPINANKPKVTGTVQSWAISPALPAGLEFNTTTGAITGTPTAASAATDYTVTATNAAGSILNTVTITVAAAENYATWANMKTFNLNTTTAGANVASGQTNFPTLVRLTSAHAAIFAGAKGDGSDVRFSLPDDSRLAYEIDRWDSAAQKAEIWVLMPAVSASGTTPVRIHYGNPSAASRSDAQRVFSSNSGYVGVWHMGNPVGGNAQTGIRPNSGATGSANNATPQNLAGGWQTIEGIVGRADTVSGVGTLRAGTAAVYRIGDLPKGTFPDSNLTFSGWVSVSVTGSLYRSFLTASGDTSFTNQNAIAVGSSGTGSQRLGLQATPNGNPGWPSTANTTWSQNVWMHFSMSMRKGSGNDSMYKDGTYRAFSGSAGTEAIVPDVNRTFNYIAANFAPNDANLNGRVDEMRMSNVARDRHWTMLEYKNQKTGSNPITDLTYSAPSYTFVEESAITPVAAPTVIGAATRFAVSPTLPAGLSFNASTGAITGTPLDASASQAYTVTAYGDSAWSTTTSFNLAITSLPPSGIDYSADTVTYQAGVLGSVTNTPTNLGTIISWSVTPSLPAGLSLNTATGVISGEPIAATAQTNYQIIGTGPDGSDTAIVVITVTAPSEDFTAWSNNRPITLNTSATGSNVAGTVTNFPVLVRLGTAEASIFSQALAAGADVRFSKANNVTRLPFQIVSWDATAKAAEIWVRVDTVYGDNATQSIKMYWGKGDATTASSSTDVFGASTGFAAVWHMGGTSGNESDATSNNFIATAVNAPLDTTGMIGRSRHFNGTNQHLAVGSSATGALNFEMTDNYTLSAWVFVSAVPATSNSGISIINKADNQYALAAYDGAASPKYWEITTRGNNTYLQARSNTGVVTTANSHIGSWRLIKGTYRGGPVNAAIAESLYIDGALINTLASTNSNNTGRNTTFNVHIGTLGGGTAPGTTFSRYFPGRIDELRVANMTRSAHWAKLDFESQKAYQTLTNIGYNAPVISYAADSINATAGLPISTQTPTLTGTVSAALSINPALPAGLSLNTSTGAISGTVAAMYGPVTHYVTATNNGASAMDSIVITVVNPAAPPAPVIIAPLFDATNVPVPFTAVWNKVTPPVTSYRLQGSEDSTFATTPLDTIVTDTSFSATEAPYATRLHLRVRAANAGGNGEWSDTISFNTIIAPPAISYTPDSVMYSVGLTIAALDDSSTGGAVASYAITPDLNAATGLTFNTTTGAITGTPTQVSATTTYSVVATNIGGTDTAVVKIGVKLPAPIIAYNSPNFFTVGLAITPLTPMSTGGVVTSYAISPDLTANTGLAFNTTTGAISGTPDTVTAATDYTVIVTGPDGLDTAVVNITTTNEDPPVIAYTNTPQVYTKGTMITALTADTTGTGPIDSIRVAPALPAGLTLAADGTISGTPTVVAPMTSYVVSAYGLGGIDTETVVITVNDVPPVIAYATPQTFAQGTAATAVTPNSTSGAVVTYSVLGTALPAGLTLNAVDGSISGTPTAGSAAADYSILATNSGGLDTAVINITVNGAPVISGQPANRTVATGGTAGFKVVAAASVSGGTLSYQWRKGTTNLTNGANVVGATTDTLTLTGLALADTGAYNVVVTSTLNSTTAMSTSSNATVFVNAAPVISGQPTNRTVVAGASAGFKVTVAAGAGTSAGTLSYQWRKGTTNLVNGANVAGATSDTLTLSNVAVSDTAGNYNVVVTRTLNATTTNVTSSNVALRVNAAPVISGQPANRTVVAGASAGFKATATVAGGGTLSYQWRKGTTNLVNGANVAGATSDTLTLLNVALGDTATNYNVVVTSTLNSVATSTTSGNATLFVNTAPVISGQPANRTVISGTSAGFKVTAAAGTGTSTGTVSYQWRKGTTNLVNGANVAGATSDTLTLSNVALADTSGAYNVVVTHTLNATTTTTTSSNAALRVNFVPIIMGQPVSRTVVAGAAAGYKVTAVVAGGGTLSYQWRKGTTNLVNGANVAGATSDTLTLTGAALADTGAYNVVVTSTLNSVTTSMTSGDASLFVNATPVITTQPATTAQIVTGTNLTLNVVVATTGGSSAGTLSYQWRKGTTNLSNSGTVSGATSATLVLTAPTFADTGTYSVVVTRTLNGTTTTVTSANSVVQPPVSIMPGSFVFHVSGATKPYTFVMPAGAVTTEKVTMSINDVWGRTLWTHSIYPSRDVKAREITWNGMTSTGRQVSAGMYIVKLSVQENGQTTRYVQKAVTLKPAR